jgi:peptide/nickel transport system substrate-binding protein
MTLVTPPNSFNFLTLTTGSSSVPTIFMQWSNPVGFDLPNGNVEHVSAMTDWFKVNSNYTVWQFNVRPGMKWSNGTPVSANDILGTFGPGFGFNSTYDFAGLGPEVKSETAVNSSLAQFVLKAPDSQWYQKLRSDYYTTTYPAAMTAGGAAATFFGTDMSIGPYYVSNYSAGSFSMQFVRNPYFVPTPGICQINVNFVDSLSLTSSALQSGTTDFAFVEYSNAKAILAANPNLRLYDEKGYGITDIQYNDSVFPYSMPAFRQALAWSVNQSQIVKTAFAGYGLTAYNAPAAVSPIATAQYNPNTAHYGFNQQQALSLLSSIGIKKGSDGHLQYSNGTDITLNMWVDTDNTADPVAAQIVQQDLQSLGFKVSLTTTTAGNIVGQYSAGPGPIRNGMILATINVAYFGNSFLDTLPGWDVYWLPTVPNRHWLYPVSADNQYNSNVTAFQSTSDTTQDLKYLWNMESLMGTYLPSLPLAYPDKLFAVNTQYYNNYPPGNLIYYSYVWNWTAMATIRPTAANPIVGITTSTTTPPTTSVSTTSTPSATTTAPTSTTQDYTLYYVAAVVIVVIIVLGAVLLRRRPSATGAGPPKTS